MNTLKRIAAGILSTVFLFGMAACSSTTASETTISGDTTALSSASDAGNTAAFTTVEEGKLIMATNAFFPPYEFYEGDKVVGIHATTFDNCVFVLQRYLDTGNAVCVFKGISDTCDALRAMHSLNTQNDSFLCTEQAHAALLSRISFSKRFMEGFRPSLLHN